MASQKVRIEKARNAFSGREYTVASIVFDNDDDVLWFGEYGPFIVSGRGDDDAKARESLRKKLTATAAELERLAIQVRAMTGNIMGQEDEK